MKIGNSIRKYIGTERNDTHIQLENTSRLNVHRAVMSEMSICGHGLRVAIYDNLFIYKIERYEHGVML